MNNPKLNKKYTPHPLFVHITTILCVYYFAYVIWSVIIRMLHLHNISTILSSIVKLATRVVQLYSYLHVHKSWGGSWLHAYFWQEQWEMKICEGYHYNNNIIKLSGPRTWHCRCLKIYILTFRPNIEQQVSPHSHQTTGSNLHWIHDSDVLLRFLRPTDQPTVRINCYSAN